LTILWEQLLNIGHAELRKIMEKVMGSYEISKAQEYEL